MFRELFENSSDLQKARDEIEKVYKDSIQRNTNTTKSSHYIISELPFDKGEKQLARLMKKFKKLSFSGNKSGAQDYWFKIES